MSWYRTGTVTVTNGSTTVTGSGTAWVANSRVGDAFVGPDGLTYEITNIASNTAISILPAYRSASGSGQSYSIIPVQGYTKTLADQASDLVNSYDKPWNVADDAADARSELGLGNAATRDVGVLPNNVLGFGSRGLGNKVLGNEIADLHSSPIPQNELGSMSFIFSGFQPANRPSGNYFCGHYFRYNLSDDFASIIGFAAGSKQLYYKHKSAGSWSSTWINALDTSNTTIDSNGFVKSASPIIRVFSDHVDLNSESEQQKIYFVANGIGDYTIIGTTGFSLDGWYIETPRDSNGNIKCFVEYEQIEQSDGAYTINVKTFEPDYSEGPAKAGVPKHIPEGRWIDIRLQPLPASEQGDQVGNDGEN
ncbi:hypothetical protein I6M29_11170 [Shewanella algae]|uniref:phage tail fiber protein n=1 Tax=Shewanella algae TaxID=38313 RepID=UPI001AAF3BD4|nr:hypothetical protein [Shewanella algae]MBO2578114.1 hypothetical protein [Shewanella algae]